MSPPSLRVAVVGLGPVGRGVAERVAAAPDLRLAGLVEPGRTPVDGLLGLAVLDDVEKLDAIDVAVVCTTPYFDRLAPTLRQCFRIKAHVVSDCAEMAWPWLRHPHLADVIADEARRAGVAIVGVGVQPGFALDTLPLAFAATLSGVTKVRATRTVRVADLHADDRRRLGLGLAPDAFRRLAKERRLGRPGLGESAVILAQGLDRHPRQADVRTATTPLMGGETIVGIRQTAGLTTDGLKIELVLNVVPGDEAAEDAFEIVGDRAVRVVVPNGTPDAAAVNVLMNTVLMLPRLAAGLRTVLDLPAAARQP